MKQKDFLVIGVIIVISIFVSLYISKKIIVPPKNQEQQVVVIQPISSTFPLPSSKYFNSNSIDPAQLITIGQSANSNPFNGVQ